MHQSETGEVPLMVRCENGEQDHLYTSKEALYLPAHTTNNAHNGQNSLSVPQGLSSESGTCSL